MRRKYFALLGTVVLASMWIGCGQKSEAPESSGPAPTVIHPNGKPVDPSTAGEVTGVIKLDGTPPAMRNLAMAAVPSCAKEHADNPAKTEDVVPGDGGTLQNVVVYLQGDFSAYTFDIPQTPAMLDQKGCQYVPHVIALMTSQPLEVTSSDTTEHNVNFMPKNNPRGNRSESPGAGSFRQSFARPEVAIPVKCNIHPWMKAYIAVLDTPYFAVTGKDGSFALHNVPPGNYTLTAWQETYGMVQQSVAVGAKETKNVTLTFKASGS